MEEIVNPLYILLNNYNTKLSFIKDLISFLSTRIKDENFNGLISEFIELFKNNETKKRMSMTSLTKLMDNNANKKSQRIKELTEINNLSECIKSFKCLEIVKNKKIRKPSEYNLYIKNMMPYFKEKYPNGRERMKMLRVEWKIKKESMK